MIPYIILILILLSGAVLDLFDLKKNQTAIILYVIVGFCILLCGLRFNTGADWAMYKSAFYSMPSQGNYFKWEYGYFLLSNLFYYLFGNYYVLQFFAVFLLFIAAAKLYIENTEYPLFSIALFVFSFFGSIIMCQVRQAIAVAIVMLGVKYIFDKKFFHFLFVILFACFFHISAIIAFPLYFLNRKIRKSFLIAIVLISQLFYLYPTIIFDAIKVLIPLMPSRLANLAHIYLNYEVFIVKGQVNTGIYFLSIIFLTLFLVIFVKPKDNKSFFILNTFVFAFFIKNLSSGVAIMERFLCYYSIFGLMAYPLFFSTIRLKQIKQKTKVVVLGSFLLVFLTIPFARFFIKGKTQIDNVTGRPYLYAYVPYYNVLYHPYEAAFRKDWWEK